MQTPLDFDDIFGIWEPAWWQDPKTLVLLGVVIALTCLALYFVMQWWRKRAVVRDPRAVALKRLYALRVEQLPNTYEEHKRFYVELIGLLKEYLDTTCAFNCMSKTDAELLTLLKTSAVEPRYYTVMQLLVAHSCPIRFALASGTPEILKDDYDAVALLLTRRAHPI